MEKDTIYVTDDDPGIRELVAEYLTRQGYAVETAEDAAALDRLLAARRPRAGCASACARSRSVHA
jgi:two-component system OmpR family response regulator/two-component system phosphate regulon response regulator OmpR